MELTDDLCDCVLPGDVVTVCGFIKAGSGAERSSPVPQTKAPFRCHCDFKAGPDSTETVQSAEPGGWALSVSGRPSPPPAFGNTELPKVYQAVRRGGSPGGGYAPDRATFYFGRSKRAYSRPVVLASTESAHIRSKYCSTHWPDTLCGLGLTCALVPKESEGIVCLGSMTTRMSRAPSHEYSTHRAS